jgi:hypothetical protein
MTVSRRGREPIGGRGAGLRRHRGGALELSLSRDLEGDDPLLPHPHDLISLDGDLAGRRQAGELAGEGLVGQAPYEVVASVTTDPDRQRGTESTG